MEETIVKISSLTGQKSRLACFGEDGKLLAVFSASLIHKYGIETGRELTLSLYEQMIREEKALALDSVFYWLGLKAHTHRELELYLKRKKYEQPVIDEVIEKVESYNFVNDEELSEREVESMSRRGLGRGAVRQKLLERGISKETLQKAMEYYSEDEEKAGAVHQAEILWHRYRNDEPRKRWQKTCAALVRKGYSWECVKSAVYQAGAGEITEDNETDA